MWPTFVSIKKALHVIQATKHLFIEGSFSWAHYLASWTCRVASNTVRLKTAGLFVGFAKSVVYADKPETINASKASTRPLLLPKVFENFGPSTEIYFIDNIIANPYLYNKAKFFRTTLNVSLLFIIENHTLKKIYWIINLLKYSHFKT